MLIGQLPQGRWNVGGAFRPCTCNIINRLIGHEYTHSANEYTHLSVWDHEVSMVGPHPPRGAALPVCFLLQSAHLPVSAQLYGILDHMDNSNTLLCECRPPDKARLDKAGLESVWTEQK